VVKRRGMLILIVLFRPAKDRNEEKIRVLRTSGTD
jgi:hypothetical protein